MEAKDCILTRRSVRRFANKPVDKELIEKAVAMAQTAPSWKNSQTVKYYIVTDKNKINDIANGCFGDFAHNKNIVGNAPCLAVLTSIKGIAGFNEDGSYTTSKGEHWQSFDSGCAAQTFALSLHTLGLGSVMLGIFDEAKIKTALNLPESESVSVLMPFGYAETPITSAPPRKPIKDVMNIL